MTDITIEPHRFKRKRPKPETLITQAERNAKTYADRMRWRKEKRERDSR